MSCAVEANFAPSTFLVGIGPMRYSAMAPNWERKRAVELRPGVPRASLAKNFRQQKTAKHLLSSLERDAGSTPKLPLVW